MKFLDNGAVCRLNTVKHTITQPTQAPKATLPMRSAIPRNFTLTRDRKPVSSRKMSA